MDVRRATTGLVSFDPDIGDIARQEDWDDVAAYSSGQSVTLL